MNIYGGYEIDGDLFYVVQTFKKVRPSIVTSFPDGFNVDYQLTATTTNPISQPTSGIVKITLP